MTCHWNATPSCRSRWWIRRDRRICFSDESREMERTTGSSCDGPDAPEPGEAAAIASASTGGRWTCHGRRVRREHGPPAATRAVSKREGRDPPPEGRSQRPAGPGAEGLETGEALRPPRKRSFRGARRAGRRSTPASPGKGTSRGRRDRSVRTAESGAVRGEAPDIPRRRPRRAGPRPRRRARRRRAGRRKPHPAAEHRVVARPGDQEVDLVFREKPAHLPKREERGPPPRELPRDDEKASRSGTLTLRSGP